MSQDVRTNQIALKPLPEEVPNQPWSMDNAADRLMDDVFEDVDRMLETGGTPLAPEPAEPEYVSLQSIAVPPVAMPPEMRRRKRAAEARLAAKAEKAQRSRKAFERLLLVAACASLGITLLLWLASQGRLNWLLGKNSAPTPVTQDTASQADIRFMDYMQRSLETIEQRAEDRKEVTVSAAPPVTNPQVPVPLPGNLPPVPVNRAPSALERVYIPVYPRTPQTTPRTQQAKLPASLAARPYPQGVLSPTARPVAPSPVARSTATAAGSAAATPTARPTTVASRPAASAPTARPTASAPATRPTTAASRPAAPTARPTTTASRPTVPVPVPPPPATAVVPPTNQAASRTQESVQAAASQTSGRHVLRGLLKADDSSKDAALFEVNGITRRIYVGETISSSVWTLVEVRNSEAIIRRNGEVRSIYPEQQF